MIRRFLTCRHFSVALTLAGFSGILLFSIPLSSFFPLAVCIFYPYRVISLSLQYAYIIPTFLSRNEWLSHSLSYTTASERELQSLAPLSSLNTHISTHIEHTSPRVLFPFSTLPRPIGITVSVLSLPLSASLRLSFSLAAGSVCS